MGILSNTEKNETIDDDFEGENEWIVYVQKLIGWGTQQLNLCSSSPNFFSEDYDGSFETPNMHILKDSFQEL